MTRFAPAWLAVVAALAGCGYHISGQGDLMPKSIHTIAVTRMRCHQPTQAYVQRRRAEGKTDREIRRCIKRYLARHLYRALSHGILSST